MRFRIVKGYHKKKRIIKGYWLYKSHLSSSFNFTTCRREGWAEVISKKIMWQVDFLEGVLHPIKQPLNHAPHGVVAEVNYLERDVTGREYLGGKKLPTHVALRELLNVVP